jgi:hypothetical protein
MRTFTRFIAAAGFGAAALSSAGAQAPAKSIVHLSPYAGYMVFGNYLNGPLGTSLSTKAGMLYGTQLGLSITPNLQLVGNIGYTSSSLDVGLPIIGGISVGHSSTLVYDADLEYDFTASRGGVLPFTPFVQAGIGAMKYDVGASVLDTHATNVAYNVGIGGDVALGRGVALRLLAKDYIGKFDFQDATSFDIKAETAHNFGLTAGVRLDF